MNKENKENQANNQKVDQNSKKKININAIINIILIAGLIVLYILYFTDFDRTPHPKKPDITDMEEKLSDASLQVGFVNVNKLVENYEFAQKKREEMLEEQYRLETELSNRQREFQQKVEEFQQQMQQGLISQEEAQIKEQELMQEQQELMALNEEYNEKLRQKEIEHNEEVFNSISNFIEKHKEEFGFDLVLNFSPGGGVVYGDSQYDITDKVIEKIN